MKVKWIPERLGVRCMAWLKCPHEGCDHYHAHGARYGCVLLYQVRYCRAVSGFVTDIPIYDFDSALANDPNLAFKAQKSY